MEKCNVYTFGITPFIYLQFRISHMVCDIYHLFGSSCEEIPPVVSQPVFIQTKYFRGITAGIEIEFQERQTWYDEPPCYLWQGYD